MKVRVLPFDIVFVVFLIVLSVLLIKNTANTENGKVYVQAGNSEYEYSLENEGIFTVKGENGITTFEICDDKVRVLDSECPNKTCVTAGWSKNIVCLPNKVFIQVQSETKKSSSTKEDFDAVSN